MHRTNVVGLETWRGYKTFELFEGDITLCTFNIDLLVISAFARHYEPRPGTFIGSLDENCNIDVKHLVQECETDLREMFGFWVSREISGQRFSRILCVEMVGGRSLWKRH